VGRIRLTNAAGLAALVTVGAIALSACSSSGGSTNETTSNTSSSSAPSSSTSGGGSGSDIVCSTGKLDGSGSTAQANAMDAWRKAYTDACNKILK